MPWKRCTPVSWRSSSSAPSAAIASRHNKRAGATAPSPGILNQVLLDARPGVLAGYASELDRLREEFEAMQNRIAPDQDAIATLSEELARRCAEHASAINAEVNAFYDTAEALHQRILVQLMRHAPDLAKIEWAEVGDADDDDDPLFDSTRDYLDQIKRFKRHQGKAAALICRSTRASATASLFAAPAATSALSVPMPKNAPCSMCGRSTTRCR